MRMRVQAQEHGQVESVGDKDVVMKIREEDKKMQHVSRNEGQFSRFVRGQTFPGRVVYAVCLSAAICMLVLWATGMFMAEDKGDIVFGPRKPTPEEVRAQLMGVDKAMKKTLNANKPFTKFGPPVVGWDEHRAEAIRRSTNSTSGINPKPRILLVTSSHPKPCDNMRGDQMLLKSIKNKMDYCRLHGIEIYYNIDKVDDEMLGWWVKVFLTHMLMKEHAEIDWIWWMDSDAVFTDMFFELPLDKYANHNMVMHGWEDSVYKHKSWLGINAGVFLLRNCQWSMDLLHAWAPMGPNGPLRDQLGTLLNKALPTRNFVEADDQSSLVFLMITDREKWGSKVYLESSYYFQGYWKHITDKFEEMMEQNRPGLYGDDRWPFVTHFCGCEFCCGKINPEYTTEQCLEHMDRAINFANNQVIGRYGFHHKSLTSPEYEPEVKNQTSTMAEMTATELTSQ